MEEVLTWQPRLLSRAGCSQCQDAPGCVVVHIWQELQHLCIYLITEDIKLLIACKICAKEICNHLRYSNNKWSI